jgi:hypothetical protein
VRLTNTAGAQTSSTALAPIVPTPPEIHLGIEGNGQETLEGSQSHFQKAITAFPKYAEAFDSLGLVKSN